MARPPQDLKPTPMLMFIDVSLNHSINFLGENFRMVKFEVYTANNQITTRFEA